MTNNLIDRREKINEPIFQTIIRTALTGLIITFLIRYKQINNVEDFKDKLSIIFNSFIYIGGIMVFLGHYTELFFINFLRFKFSSDLKFQMAIRIIYWYISGFFLYNLSMIVRGILENRELYVSDWWVGGFYFIVIELIINLILQLITKKSFWNGVY